MWAQASYCCVWQLFCSAGWHPRTCFQSCCPCSHPQSWASSILGWGLPWAVLTASHFWLVPLWSKWAAMASNHFRERVAGAWNWKPMVCKHLSHLPLSFVPWKEPGHSHHLISFYANIAPLSMPLCVRHHYSLVTEDWAHGIISNFPMRKLRLGMCKWLA